jgi:heptosyltransferase-2
MKQFLIIQTAFIGDVILATPVIEKIKMHYPDAEIDFLLRKGNENLLDGHPHIRNLFILNKKEQKFRNVFQMIRKIRSYRYDAVINLQRFATTGLITFFSRSKHKAGFNKNPLSFCYHTKIPHEIGTGEHEITRNLKTVIDFTNDVYTAPRLYPSKTDYDKVEHYKTAPFVTIAPTSVWFTKQFPAAKWVSFLDELDRKYPVYLTGGPADAQACQEIKRRTQNEKVEVLSGELTLLQTAALMESATMNYVNDSAPLHLASAMDAPTTAVFCSTVPDFGFYPVSSNATIVETEIDLYCRPCGLHGYKACPEGHFKCAHTIDIRKLLLKK